MGSKLRTSFVVERIRGEEGGGIVIFTLNHMQIIWSYFDLGRLLKKKIIYINVLVYWIRLKITKIEWGYCAPCIIFIMFISTIWKLYVVCLSSLYCLQSYNASILYKLSSLWIHRCYIYVLGVCLFVCMFDHKLGTS